MSDLEDFCKFHDIQFEKDGYDTFVLRKPYADEFGLKDDTPMPDYLRAREAGLRIVGLTKDGRVRETWNEWLLTDSERIKYASALSNAQPPLPADTILPHGYSGISNGVVLKQEPARTFDYTEDMPMEDYYRARAEGLTPKVVR